MAKPPRHTRASLPARPCSTGPARLPPRPAGGAAPPPADLLAPAPAAEEAREEVFLNEDLMKLIFSHLSLEDLCRAGIVRRRWRDVTNNPSFWRVIDLDGKALAVAKVQRAPRPAGWGKRSGCAYSTSCAT